MAKKKQRTNLSFILPVAIMFGILTFSSGQASSGYGAQANLFLTPTIPMFQPATSFSSFYFAASPVYVRPTYFDYQPKAFLNVNYRSQLPSPTFFYAKPTPVLFKYTAIGTPVQPIYYTPTRALYDVRYTYDNFKQVW